MTRIISTLVLLIAMIQLSGCTRSEASSTSYKADDELVVLAHGLGRSDVAMWRFAQRLEKAGYKVCRLDYASIGESVEAVLAESDKQISECIVNAPKVHFVGHSLGGLVIRAYLQNHLKQLETNTMGEVVLIGTPNQGSEVADHLSDTWIMKLGGGISHALVTGSKGLGNTLEEQNVNIGIIAGTKESNLTKKQFSGPNDGLVSVESTKLASMSDFIEIYVSHSQMRYNEEVAKQTIHFLQQGTFDHKP